MVESLFAASTFTLGAGQKFAVRSQNSVSNSTLQTSSSIIITIVSVGPQGPTGPTGAVSTLGIVSTSKTASIVYTDPGNSNTARFIVSNGQSVVLTSSSQKVQVQFVMQFANTVSAHNVGATIGRGTTLAVSTAYINLANNIAFSTTDLQITNTLATIGNLDTSLAQQWYANNNETATIIMNTIDQPGIGTFYYAVRVNCIFSSQFYIRNSYFVISIILLLFY